MDELRALLEEARARGYESPNPTVLRIAVPILGGTGVESSGAWGARLAELEKELPGWSRPLTRLRLSGGLGALARALDSYKGQIRAPLPDRIFRAFAELALRDVKVVFVGQDPYPTADRSKLTLDTINRLSHIEVQELLGDGYENWEMVRPVQWADGAVKDSERPRVRIGAVPYACGKSFAYPSVCREVPASYQNLVRGVRASYDRRAPKMDPELNTWAQQGVLMLNACPMLYGDGASGKNPNMWTAWTSEFLASIAAENPYCVYVLLGNSAKAFKRDIVAARAEACIIETGHPSSRSSSRGDFLTSDLFQRINNFFDELTKARGPGGHVSAIAW